MNQSDYPTKTVPIGADKVSISDSNDSWKVKNVLLSTFASARSLDFSYHDVRNADTGYVFRVPPGIRYAWGNAYSWCDASESSLVYTLYYSATFGGTFSSIGTIAHNSGTAVDTIDISGFTIPDSGGWLRLDITTPASAAVKSVLILEVSQ